VVREIKLALDKMYVLDELECRVQHFRPRELTQGGVDKLWDEAIRRIDEARDGRALKQTRLDMLNQINCIPIDPTARPVKIATTGEYFAVLDPFYNLDLERELGKLGAEVHRTLMMSQWVRGALVLEALGFPRRPEIVRAARPYLRYDISGEGWVTIGQTVIHAQKGFDGIVETMPFTCLPEVVAMNILPKVSRDHNIPILTFIFDEQTGRAGMKTRLEAFVDLLYRRRAVRENAGYPVSDKELRQSEPFEPAACALCPVVATCQPVPNRLRPSDCAAQMSGR
jgi:predicted nucleotide-binding protein (sugar kinase/HSP70/actin superfamily)